VRHTANTLTVAADAPTRELMPRLGHASSRAAIRYQHAISDRDRVIAGLLDTRVTEHAKPAKSLKPPVVS
jgi:integrase